jgi:hypothetical protein
VSYPLHCEPKQGPFFPSLLLLSSLSTHRTTARSCRRVSHFALPNHHTACTTSLCYCCYLRCLAAIVAALLLHRRVAIAGSSGAPPCVMTPMRRAALAAVHHVLPRDDAPSLHCLVPHRTATPSSSDRSYLPKPLLLCLHRAEAVVCAQPPSSGSRRDAVRRARRLCSTLVASALSARRSRHCQPPW